MATDKTTEQPTNVNADSTLGSNVTVHETAVAEIVGMIRAKYEDEGTRNFTIGKRAFEHAQWQKGNFPGAYLSGDFDNLMNRIRDDVRMFVPIKAESIQVAHWVRVHYLRELVTKDCGLDVATSLTMHEYLAIVGKALKFDSASLEGEINPCWLDTIKGIALDRAKVTNGVKGIVRREDFEIRVSDTINRAKAALAAKLDPVQAAAKAATEAVKASAAKVAKSTKAITDSINHGIAQGAVTPDAALAILETVAKHHGKPLVAASIGFDPSTATVADCELLAVSMFAAGKLVEMKALVAKLSAGIAKMESAMQPKGSKASAASKAATAEVASLAATA